MAGIVAFFAVRRTAQAIGVCKRHAGFVCAGGRRCARFGAVSTTPSPVCASPARLATSSGSVDGRHGPDRPLPLSLFRLVAELALLAFADDPDLGRIPGLGRSEERRV